MKYTLKDEAIDSVDDSVVYANVFLDITDDTCPITFVRTKLLLERMSPGDVALIRLKGWEPLENVPRSVHEHGHTILSFEPEDSDLSPDSVHRLLVRKS